MKNPAKEVYNCKRCSRDTVNSSYVLMEGHAGLTGYLVNRWFFCIPCVKDMAGQKFVDDILKDDLWPDDLFKDIKAR